MLVLDEPVQIETLKLVDCVRNDSKTFKKRMEAIVNPHFPAHALKIANKALMLS